MCSRRSGIAAQAHPRSPNGPQATITTNTANHNGELAGIVSEEDYGVLIVSDSLQLTIVYEPGEEGWIIASVAQVPGALSQGRTRGEARENVIDALRLLLSPEPGDAAGDREPLRLTIAA